MFPRFHFGRAPGLVVTSLVTVPHGLVTHRQPDGHERELVLRRVEGDVAYVLLDDRLHHAYAETGSADLHLDSVGGPAEANSQIGELIGRDTDAAVPDSQNFATPHLPRP